MGFRRNMKQKSFPIVKSIKFYSFDVKAIATKQSRVTFCENSQKKRNVITEILFCDFDESESYNFQNGSILFQDFTSNIFELHEPKAGGYNFPNLTRLKLPKFSRT